MVEVINKLARVQRQMLQDLGREPTPEELAVELDMTPEKVDEVQKIPALIIFKLSLISSIFDCRAAAPALSR